MMEFTFETPLLSRWSNPSRMIGHYQLPCASAPSPLTSCTTQQILRLQRCVHKCLFGTKENRKILNEKGILTLKWRQ